MDKVDKWTAEQCGVEIFARNDGVMFAMTKDSAINSTAWTMQDARCREIVRGRFNMSTYPHHSGKWVCANEGHESESVEASIAEAEISCITAIMNSSKGAAE